MTSAIPWSNVVALAVIAFGPWIGYALVTWAESLKRRR